MDMRTRIFPVTMLLNEPEFSEFKKSCKAADVKHSPLLRTLWREWMHRQTNDRRHRHRPEYTGRTKNMPISVPAKGVKGSFHVRL